MLEGLATWVLNTYLGQYLENLNTDQLSIGLVKGEVELENVPLRKDALRHLDLSIQVCAGFVGKVKLQIPVARLRSEPWIIVFQQIYLVAGPINLNEYDEEAEDAARFGRKMSQLDNIEAIWRSKQEAAVGDTAYGTSYSSWLSYGTSFITNIIENIQLKIEDVHIRYEDDQSQPGRVCSLGCTIDSLTVQSSDQHWVPKFIYAGDKSMSYKLLELKNLGLYMDSSTEAFSNKSIGELAALMTSSINGNDHDYILDPVKASACLKRNLSLNPLRSRSTPRFICDLKLEKFQIFLNDIQYTQIISSLRYHERLETARPFRKWRPACKTVLGNAREWWNYGIQCHLEQIRRRVRGRNWEFAFERAKSINSYVNIYCNHLKNPIQVTVEMQKTKLEVEQELSFEELRIIRELCMERVTKELALDRKVSKDTEPTTSVAKSGGILQTWFPDWGGWYSAEKDELHAEMEGMESSVEEPPPVDTKDKVSQLEEEILYVISDSIENNTFMKRDAVFAQLSFFLKSGNISLSTVLKPVEGKSDSPLTKKNSAVLFELGFSNVKVAFESRPRNQCFSLDVELGTMSLKDQVTKGTPFPLLISQQRDYLISAKGGKSTGTSLTSSAMYARLSSMISSVSRLSPSVPLSSQPSNLGPLFSLSYENKPSKSSMIDHRLVITSQALDIVYNQRAFGAISDFFFPPSLRRDDPILQAWTESARQRYEKLKEVTKEELKRNWDTVVQGIMTIERKRWDITLDISAPQIIVPEHFQDLNTSIVILDFGKLMFATAQPKDGEDGPNDKTSNSDDEETFETPCSTPEEFVPKEEEGKGVPVEEEPSITESSFHQHLYDKFDLKLCDMQVLVAKAKDNWRFAYQKGTGPMHVIDRFNINLHLERRALEIIPDTSSGDSQWPHLMLSGSLPQLIVHINEQKVQAIKNICAIYLLSSPKQQQQPSFSSLKDPSESETQGEKMDEVDMARSVPRSTTLTSISSKDSFEDVFKESQSNSKLIMMQFNVDKLSIELQSRGRSIAEMQVTGVRAQMSRRPCDISASLSVHSLLLVDALQTFGSDFELLVASHKHISMDSVSGSLLDSEPCSPTSPGSPDAYLPGKPTSPIALSQALNSLASNRGDQPSTVDRSYLRSPTGVLSPTLGYSLSSVDGGRDSEALINIEVTYIAATPSSNEDPEPAPSYIYSSVQFNALDVIANQETVVELVGFIHQLFAPHTQLLEDNVPNTPLSSTSKPSFYGSLAGIYSPQIIEREIPSLKAEISFDFQKLTILLLRGILKDKDVVGRKVGTAVLSHAKIEASVVNDILTCEGSLGGFQIRDVTPEGNKHQCIVSVGYDPIVERSQDFLSRLHCGIYDSYKNLRQDSSQRAFSFKVVRPLVLHSSYEDGFREPSSREEVLKPSVKPAHRDKISIQLHLASVCYTHSPQFLVELKSCAKEFKEYMTRVASSIKQAATEVAIGLVSKRIESFSSISTNTRDASPRHLSYMRGTSISRSTDTLIFPQPPPVSTRDSTSHSPSHDVVPDLSFSAELDIVLETPIVVLPEAPTSPNVLVAHLGQISIKNKELSTDSNREDVMDFFPTKTVAFEVAVKDMSLFALNVDERLRSRDITFHPLSATMMNAEELYSCKEHGTPILHNASLEFTLIQRKDAGLLSDFEAGLVFPTDICIDHHPLTTSDSFSLEGGFITPLKVSVSRRQYQLLRESVSNLSFTSSKLKVDGENWKRNPIMDKKIESEVSSSTRNGSNCPEPHVSVKGCFTIPSLCVELRGDICQTEQPLVNLVLENISAVYDSSEPFKSNTQVMLCSLALEDLHLKDSQSEKHYLMKSENLDPVTTPSSCRSAPLDIPKGALSSAFDDGGYLSTSCPEMWVSSHLPVSSGSLPSKLEMEKPYFKALRKASEVNKRPTPEVLSMGCPDQKSNYPFTPPPSPTPDKSNNMASLPPTDGALVNITIFTVDERSPDFYSKYDGNGKFLDVELNCLRTVVNLESWVMLFDFFRSPSQEEKDESKSKPHFGEPIRQDIPPIEEANIVLEVNVKSLTLVLNKPEGELAKASINQVWVRSVGSVGDLTLNGRLGSLSLVDCTPYGSHYKEKFLTVGTEAMTFQLFRHSTEDPSLLRKCDIRLKLKMSSIMYVHSHRFLQELMQFFQHFILLRDKLSDWRALRAGLKVNLKRHGTRVSLDICAGSPIIFIPMWNQSDQVLAVDLGSLSVSNKFLWSGSPETISKVRRGDLFDRLNSSGDGRFRSRSGSARSRSSSGSRRYGLATKTPSLEEVSSKECQNCLLDVMSVNLTNIDLFRSERIDSVKRQKKSVGQSTDGSWDFGSFRIIRKGSSLLENKCALKLQVERNLDGEISRIVPDFSIHGILTKIHVTVDLTTYKLIRGLLEYNLGEPVPEMSLQPVFLKLQQAAKLHRKVPFPLSYLWTTLNIHFDLDDVIVEANCCEEGVGESSFQGIHCAVASSPFARVHFIKSKLLYESFSDSSKDVDLVSQEIILSDTRFRNSPANKRSNVFSNILTPAQDKNLKNENPLQAEIHYRSTRDVTRFTVLLNNMRLMAILEWWKAAHIFIQASHPGPKATNSQVTGSNALNTVDWPTSTEVEEPSPKTVANPLRLNPMVESTGLMTKHSIISDQYQIPFELKINITDSELVLVENSSEWDSSAVILKTTAVLSYRPHFQEHPVSCNLNQCELYSCTLGLEEETALSIIDPVTVNIEVNDHASKSTSVDISHLALENQHTIEMSLHQLNIRLSYHDMKMFQRIIESLPRQTEQVTGRKGSQDVRSSQGKLSEGEPANFAAQVEKLSVLGFSQEDCLKSLKACGCRLDEAALWLTQNAVPQSVQSVEDKSPPTQANVINIQGFELKTGCVNVSIIDDCRDCDVPLLEVCLSHLGLKQNCDWKGSAGCTLSIDYYNRALSGWEPFIEPWKCYVDWKRSSCGADVSSQKFHLSLKSEGVVNVTVSSTLLDLYRLVKDNWTEDYYNRERTESEGRNRRRPSKELVGGHLTGQHRRTPFVPFALKNDTGCDLLFCPLLENNRSTTSSEFIFANIPGDCWRNVPAGELLSFTFEEKAGKQRHGNSHAMKSHRLVIKVGMWNIVGPITVDKVGVFFRECSYPAGSQPEMPSVRVVFDISMDGLARKLIRVRSALMVTNLLPHTIELKLENIAIRLGDVKVIQIPCQRSAPIPLLYVWSRIYVKPYSSPSHPECNDVPSLGCSSWIFCREPISWKSLPLSLSEDCTPRVCYSVQGRNYPYRFFVHVRKDKFPSEVAPTKTTVQAARSPEMEKFKHNMDWIQPGHKIFLVSPLVISNMLPFDLHYKVEVTGDQGRIRTGQDSFLSSVNPEEEINISFWIDNFAAVTSVTIRQGNCPYLTSEKLNDSNGRPVHLQVKVIKKFGKALKVKVSAFFWLINKTGIPIVFKQEGTTVDAAGQDAEHEVARCAAPLLFSFSDLEASPTIVARVGKKLHLNAEPHFCKRFPLTQGTWVRRLHVLHKDHRPDLVYEIGVDVRSGRGRFRDTHMVTLSPRFQLENRSSHELLISQKCFIPSSFVDSGAQSTWLRAIPKCWLPFHWPRLDKDHLLCVCLCDVPGSHWSGGFLIDKTDSFNINIRNAMGESHFLRVEVLMSDATYFVVFSDSHYLPPPFRVDNFSLVPITYYQTGTHEDHLRSVVKPRYCVAYAWDEVTLPPYLTCVAPGGTSATYSLNALGEGARLTYENFIYIAFTGTFKEEVSGYYNEEAGNGSSLVPSDMECLQLVLDVAEGSRVRLGRKEIGRRSQLWRMTSTGMLQHEGSSPPYDPSSKKPRRNANNLVLDIAGSAPLPTEYTPLMLRKPDDRRRLTQTWRFTEDGRLCCQHPNMFVQPKEGFLGLSSGSDVVLGPHQRVHYGTMPNGIPLEQAVGRQRLRPGSGVLAIKVVMDGPTRALQITDVQNKSSPQVARTDGGDLVYIKESGITVSSALSNHPKQKPRGTQTSSGIESFAEEVQMQIILERGIGLSLVSSPEELLYALSSGIVFEYMSSPEHRTFDCSVKDIQMDNQLPKAQCGVVLYVSPQSKTDESRHLPALQVSCHQLISSNLNAYIFKHLIITLKNITLTIEEELLCKFLVLLGQDRRQANLAKVEESEYETQRMLAAATSANATRLYFTHLKLVLNQMRLSVLTSKSLTTELRNTRRKLGLTLVQFENALVSLDPFIRCHPFETSTFLIDSIRSHYESELRSQAMRILGSTDFLGNPFGLLADVSEGVQELVREGSVGGLVMNVTHGMANSTAKVTGTLSNAVGRVTMDTQHEETRQRLLSRHFGNSPDHLVAGLMGFGLGLYGGLTSIVAQTYTGATKEGLPGFFSGFAKGMVGTVTKPAIGFLDLAAGTASAVRETSKNPSHKSPSKVRKPRVVLGMNGMMPRYSENDARGFELMRFFDNFCQEIFLAYEVLQEGEEDLRVLISSEKVLVFRWTDTNESPIIVLRIDFKDLFVCRPISLGLEMGAEETRYYIELTMKAEVNEVSSFSVTSSTYPSQLLTKRPKVRCDSMAIATKVTEEINFAKTLHEELRHTITDGELEDENLEDC